MAPLPKPKSMRQRRNRTTTAATLAESAAPAAAPMPPLPKVREWHPLTVEWWSNDVTGLWASPMAPEFARADIHGLYRLAGLVDDYWKAEKPRERAALNTEIRLQSMSFGLTPIDRRRLQWEIKRGEDAEKARRPAAVVDTKVRDPRDVLRAVK